MTDRALLVARSSGAALAGFPFGAVMVIVLATALLTGHAHRVGAAPVDGAADGAPAAQSPDVAAEAGSGIRPAETRP
jgi:hypothetical protein